MKPSPRSTAFSLPPLPRALRVAQFERDHLIFDVVAMFGLTTWSAGGLKPWWGVLAVLAIATAVNGIFSLGSRVMRAATSRLTTRRPAASIALDATGMRVELRRPATALAVAWSDIAEIVAMKADLYTTDCITLAIGTRSGETIVLDETMDGWDRLVHELARHVDSEPFEAWFLRVAFPAFEANPRRIFPKADDAETAAPAEPELEAAFAIGEDAESGEPDTPGGLALTYLGSGTGSLFTAAGLLLAATSVVKHDGRLVLAGAAIVAYVIVSRAALFGAFAWRDRRCESTG